MHKGGINDVYASKALLMNGIASGMLHFMMDG